MKCVQSYVKHNRPIAARVFALFCVLVVVSGAMNTPIAMAERQLGERQLSFGAWGADVFWLQQKLIRLGYNLTADGHFGTGTRRVVTAFQLSQSLTPDGIVGPDTLQALNGETTVFYYVVRPGDSLWALSRRFGVSIEDILTANRMSHATLHTGQTVIIPSHFASAPALTRRYTVQPGDTLSGIARRFNTTVQALSRQNGIDNPSLIRAGSVIVLP